MAKASVGNKGVGKTMSSKMREQSQNGERIRRQKARQIFKGKVLECWGLEFEL